MPIGFPPHASSFGWTVIGTWMVEIEAVLAACLVRLALAAFYAAFMTEVACLGDTP